jgi:hypothetical protein
MQSALEQTLERTQLALELAEKTLKSAKDVHEQLKNTYDEWIDDKENAINLAKGRLEKLKEETLPNVGRSSRDYDDAKDNIELYLEELIDQRSQTEDEVAAMLERTYTDAKTIEAQARAQADMLELSAVDDDRPTQEAARKLGEVTITSGEFLAKKMRELAEKRKNIILKEINDLVDETRTMLENFEAESTDAVWNALGVGKINYAQADLNMLKSQKEELIEERAELLKNAEAKISKWENETIRLEQLVNDASEACNKGKGGHSQSFKKVKNRSSNGKRDSDGLIDDDDMNAIGRTSESIRVNKKSKAPESIKKKSAPNKLNKPDGEKQMNTEEVNNFSNAWENFQRQSQ